MTGRAVSTVVDVSVFALLVVAAVGSLFGAPVTAPDPAQGRAGEVSTTLAGSTATVSYARDGVNRSAHGTLLGLLADAAVADAGRVGDGSFRAAVANATRPALSGHGWRGQVVVTWRPHEAADPAGHVAVGPPAPDDADVYAATTTVPSGVPPIGPAADTAADRDGYLGVATVVADSHPGLDDRSDARRGLAAELEAAYDSPAAAAGAVSVGRAVVTVRTWSA